MIQRIQTVYLLVAVVLCVVCLCMEIGVFSVEGFELAHEYNLWLVNFTGTRNFATWPLFGFCLFSIMLRVGWYAIYAAYALMLMPGTADVKFTPSWASVCPMAALVFTFLAQRAIKADERLVRAADRIR